MYTNHSILRARVQEVHGLWDELKLATEKKGAKLREAGNQQQFNRNIEDIEMWLSEVEGQIASEDYGKDLTSVQNLQKKHQLLEADVAAHQERINGVTQQARQFENDGHFDASSILQRENYLRSRYENLKAPCEKRKRKLDESSQVWIIKRIQIIIIL
jgi:spectrin alpha